MKLLVCGTRKKGYEKLVERELEYRLPFELVEGCCPDSADQYAEDYCNARSIKIHHFPSHEGNYLKRNIEMVDLCDEVLAFWDGFSYGTAHAIAHAVLKNKPVRIIMLNSRGAR